MHPQTMSHGQDKGHSGANLIEIMFISIIFIYFFNRENDKTSTIHATLSFKIIRLTFCDLTYSRWRPEWLPDYYNNILLLCVTLSYSCSFKLLLK